MSQDRHISQRSMKRGTRAPILPAGESQVCRMELLEPRLLLSAIVSVDAGPDQTVSEGQAVQFAGSYVAGPPPSGTGWQTTQLTDSAVDAGSYSIDGTQAAWVQGGVFGDVFYSPNPWAPPEGREVVQLNMSGPATGPQVQGDYVVWHEQDAAVQQGIFLYNTLTRQQSDIVPFGDFSTLGNPVLSGHRVVWTQSVSGEPDAVWCYDIDTGARAPVHWDGEGAGGQHNPQVSGDKVIWLAPGTDGNLDVFMKDLEAGGPVLNVSSSSVEEQDARISGDNIIWWALVGDYSQIFEYDISTAGVTQLSDSVFDSFSPRISGQNVAWISGDTSGGGSALEIFFWDGSTVTQVTNDAQRDDFVDISGTSIVWAKTVEGGSRDVFFFDAATGETSRITNNGYDDIMPLVSGRNIAWTGQVGGSGQNHEMFFAKDQSDVVYAYAWDFGDGGTALGTLTPEYAYAFDGEYVATLTVMASDGSQMSDDLVVSVAAVGPTAEILGAPPTGQIGEEITLTGNVRDPDPSDTYVYSWTIARGGDVYAQSTDPTITFTPDACGTYVVVLAVMATDGEWGDFAWTEINVQSVGSTVAIDGPTTGTEGAPITLTAIVNNSDINGTFEYAWTIYRGGEAYTTGSNPTITFTPDDNGIYGVLLAVLDSDEVLGFAQTEIDVQNVAPTAAIAGPSVGVRGQALSFAASYTDPGTLDTQTVAWQVVDAGGAVVAAGTGTAIGFTPADLGTYHVGVVVTDKDGGVGTGSAAVQVQAAGILTDPVDGKPALFVGGGSGADKIDVRPGSQAGTVAVYIGNQLTGEFSTQAPSGEPLARIVIFGGAGGDDIKLAPNLPPIPAELYGGAGDDKLAGGPGNDIIVGGDGNDFLWGDNGNDLLIGGAGTDKLMGGKGDDVLVGSSYSEENNRVALRAIMDEWERTDISYVLKCLHLTYGANVGPVAGLNGDWVLDETTITDDGVRDKVFGEQGQDYFLIGLEDATDWNLFSELLTVAEVNFLLTI
jgi:Tol biopolymer transport system component